jgi:hypothetical protein
VTTDTITLDRTAGDTGPIAARLIRARAPGGAATARRPRPSREPAEACTARFWAGFRAGAATTVAASVVTTAVVVNVAWITLIVLATGTGAL